MSIIRYAAAILTAGVLTSLMFSASAKEYLFKLREDTAVPFSTEASLFEEECFNDDSALATVGGVYTTDDISIIEKYMEMGLLEYYEENSPAYLFDMPYTDEYLSTPVSGYVPVGESLAQLNADAFWKLGLSGKGITVGVIDSGANAHSDLAENLLSGCNTVDGTLVSSDGYGHGTMVAGFIAASGTSYRGTAYNAKIVPIKAFDDEGKNGSTGTMADGIYKAIDVYGCDVINMSCGTPGDKETLKNAVKYAIDNGVIMVAASGNVTSASYGTSTVGSYDSLMYPACYDGVVSVGNIDRYGNLSSTSIENDYVDVVANGKAVTGLSNTNLSGYRGGSGTSFACPVVTGIVACMLEASPGLTPAQIEALLQETATDLGDEGKDISYGYGKVNCEAMVPELLDGKVYRSGIVRYKGKYNIAIRNGCEAAHTSRYFFATYTGNKMTGISGGNISLSKGQSMVISESINGTVQKYFELNIANLAPLKTLSATN